MKIFENRGFTPPNLSYWKSIEQRDAMLHYNLLFVICQVIVAMSGRIN